MNRRQRSFALAGAATCAAAVLFPPFHHAVGPGNTIPAGFGLLFSPPSLLSNRAASVDIGLLTIELVVIVIVTAVLIAISDDRNS
jgi:hypothetical protein